MTYATTLEEVLTLRSENAQLRSQLVNEQWQPIETAPKDGTRILVTILSRPQNTYVARWREGAWQAAPLGDWNVHPTHWTFLPAPPLSLSDDIREPIIGGTAFCGHGVMASLCEKCSQKTEVGKS